VRAAISAGNTIAVDASAANVGALAALSRIAADASAAATTSAALTNTLLGALRAGAANDNLLGPAQNLVQLAQAIRGDVQPLAAALAVANNWLATLRNHAVEQVSALGVASRIATDASAAQVAAQNAGNNLAVTIGASHTAQLGGINASLGTLDRSARDINASLATVRAAISAGNTIAVDASAANVGALAALSRIAADASAAATTSFAAMNRILVDASAAATTGTAIGNSHLAGILLATQAGTAHGLVTAGQIQVVANRANATVLHIATHQQYTLQGNARLVDINASLGTLDRSARDINASLGTLDRSARDINANLATVHAAISAGNAIAVDAANASTTSFAAANTIAVDSSAALVTVLGRIEAAIVGLRQDMAEVKAKIDASNTIAATGHQIVATTTRDTLAITNGELARANTTLRALAS
jgi:prefoldin subunit 5